MSEIKTSRAAVVVGASSGVGRALATELARQGYALVLAARERRDLEAVAADLRVRFGVEAHARPLDLGDPDFDAATFLMETRSCLGGIDAVVISAGMISPDDEGLTPSPTIERLTTVNFTSIAKLTARACDDGILRSDGTIVLFSSIAAGAPRRKNPAYGAAKAALEYFAKALRHHLATSRTIIQVYTLGYVDTAMTYGMPLLFPVASPASVAERVVRDLRKDFGRRSYPWFWDWIIVVLRNLPWFLYKRLSF